MDIKFAFQGDPNFNLDDYIKSLPKFKSKDIKSDDLKSTDTNSSFPIEQRVLPLLHPEGTEFYRKVASHIDPLLELQRKEIVKSEKRFPFIDPNTTYEMFRNHASFPIWERDSLKCAYMSQSFNDLLYINTLVVKGDLPISFYHFQPIYDIDWVSLSNINRKLGFLTMDGQSGTIIPKVQAQKSYILGIIDTRIFFETVKPFLDLNTDKFYYQYNIVKSKDIGFSSQDIPFEGTKSYPVTFGWNKETNDYSKPSTWILKLDPKRHPYNQVDIVLDDNRFSKQLKSSIKENCTDLSIFAKDFHTGNVTDLLNELLLSPSK